MQWKDQIAYRCPLGLKPPGIMNCVCVCVCVCVHTRKYRLYCSKWGETSSQHPDARGGWKPKPFSALRRPSSLLKSVNPTAPPHRTTPHPHDKLPHQILITYSTIAARAVSFHRQVLADVTPLQLAQNGLHCKPSPESGGLAYCFACGSTRPLYTLQNNPIEQMQQLHLADCIWQIICRDLKPVFETPDNVTHSSTASASHQRPPPETVPASFLPDEPSISSIDPVAEQSSTIPEPGTQHPQPTCSAEVSQSPQPLHSPCPATSTLDQRPTYASVLQRFKPPLPQPTSKAYQAAHSLRRTLTIEDLYRRYHNKPSPFKFGKKTSKSSADRARARNKNATATQSLTKFLISALPAFSQLLSEMQPAADNCWQSYRGTHYSRAARAA